MTSRLFLLSLHMGSCSLAMASYSSPLQDFCVVVPKRRVFVNGEVCKDPKIVRADNFFFSGLHLMRDTSNAVGSNVTVVTVAELPGLNTFGISMARIDFALLVFVNGKVLTLHTHTPPKATEILTVLEGNIEVRFVTSNPENYLISKDLQKGDVFLFPQGLVHFHRNIGNNYAVVIAALSSHNPGAITIVNAMFDSNPDIARDLLAKAFQMDKNVVY
ncbi:Cupin 1 [Cynara cardunculus var. scolymus]|uniref:Germin-like protein n=1 Tax=Cynara cardunculus var. scolymus TaxID=59895 RepID=A0A103Y457_CYNCS|nr:Cupin 1 [Cynara cardunculus var. scolymus]